MSRSEGIESLFQFLRGRLEAPNGASLEMLLVIDNFHVRPVSALEERLYEAVGEQIKKRLGPVLWASMDETQRNEAIEAAVNGA